jgi:hypothetical protein
VVNTVDVLSGYFDTPMPVLIIRAKEAMEQAPNKGQIAI